MTDANLTNDNAAANARHHTDKDCKDRIPTMEFMGFGKAYVPQQELCELFSAKDGFEAGTIFPELYLPYEPAGAQKA